VSTDKLAQLSVLVPVRVESDVLPSGRRLLFNDDFIYRNSCWMPIKRQELSQLESSQ